VDTSADKGIGFFLDTCHAWAAGETLSTPSTNLMHQPPHRPGALQDARDAAGSRVPARQRSVPDRSTPTVVAVVNAAAAVICEHAT